MDNLLRIWWSYMENQTKGMNLTDYFDRPEASNSDLKKLWRLVNGGHDEPENLQEIYDTGTLIHQVPLEHHRADVNHKDYVLGKQMRDTLLKDALCRQIILIHDFQREREFINDVHGIRGRCKMDGSSVALSLVLEYKGLGVTTEKAFHEAIVRFDYDQGATWYLDVSGFKQCLIVAVSKRNPKLMFKCLIDRNHKYYHTGLEKVERCVELWKDMFSEAA